MIWVILLTVANYFRNLFSGFISDDITVNANLKNQKYPIRWSEFLHKPFSLFHDLLWKAFKGKAWAHHIVDLALFTTITCSIYIVGQKFLPQNVALLTAMFFAVHPCNCQTGGWISAKWYGVTLLLGIWAFYFNNLVPYFISFFTTSTILPLPLLMDLSIPTKIASMALAFLIFYRVIKTKEDCTKTEGLFKRDNLRIYPRKFVVAIKSYCYYFTLALFPAKMGWFHTMGEPIDDKLKSCNLHFWLCLCLIGTLTLFLKTPAFIGLIIFTIFIAPFSNIVTPALFTSERYMAPALIGWSVFLAHLTVGYPIVAAVIITAYFMRTQLELWAYQDDFHLALYSLLNFPKSGFAWANMGNLFLHNKRPAAAFDTIKEGLNRCPEFPTLHYQNYLMNRATDLLNNQDEALDSLKKACKYGRHEGWFRELEDYEGKLKHNRLVMFKRRYVNYPQSPIVHNGHGNPLGVMTNALPNQKVKA
jgi:hypothetical protein